MTNLRDIAITSTVAHSGMRVSEALRACVAANVPGLPFCDAAGRILGRVSIRHILKQGCIPDYLVKTAHLLMDKGQPIPLAGIVHLMQKTVDEFVLANINTVGPDSPGLNALAIMESYGTEYIFVAENGHYLGTLTRMGLAQQLLELRG